MKQTIKPITYIITMPTGKTTQCHAWRESYKGFVAFQENGKWHLSRCDRGESPAIRVKILLENYPTCNAHIVPHTMCRN